MTPTRSTRLRLCKLCGGFNPIVRYRFVAADVEVSACRTCDGLTARHDLKKEP